MMVGFGLWQWVGVALVLWVLYDLLMGYTYSFRLILRAQEPLHYWMIVALWSAIAAVTLFWG